MAYVIPQVQVFQDFAIRPAANLNPLRAHISGPHAFLLRYSVEEEKVLAFLDFYDDQLDQSYLWPERPAGGLIDDDYSKIFIDNALLKYFEDSVGAGYTITRLAGFNNRIKSATGSFVTNGSNNRLPELLDRDVKLGDIIKVRAQKSGGGVATLWSYVQDLLPDEVGGSVDAAVDDANNAATQTDDSAVVQIAGTTNCITVTSDESAYDGLVSGYINETYTIIVLEGSIGGDLTTALIRVLSGSGTDDILSMSPEAVNTPTEIGTRGLTATFGLDTGECEDTATAESVPPNDLIAGQRFLITVEDAFTAPVATSSGDYDGFNSTTYIATVSKGGLWSQSPQVIVTTIDGTDLSGPTVVEETTDFSVGTHGVLLQFSGAGLRKGDKYYITVTGLSEGPIRTIVLGHNLDSLVLAGTECDVTLYIKKTSLAIPRNREDDPPNVNFETSQTEITTIAGITVFDASWTDNGVPVALPVVSDESHNYGRVYVEYRAWLSDLSSDVGTVSDIGDLDDAISGPLSPDNPLKWAVSYALQNSNGTEVKFTSVANPDDIDSWNNVLALTLGRDDCYGFVPLTRDRDILNLYAAHVESQSSSGNSLWRVLWTNLAGVPTIPVVHAGSTVANHIDPTTSDGEVCLAVIEDDPDTSGTQYTRVRNTNSNGDFIANGVRPGDKLRCLFTTDGFGNTTYSEFVIDVIQSEDQLRLLSGPDAPISVGAKIEIWRDLSATEEAQELSLTSGSFGSRRVMSVWPDQIESAGTLMEGYHLCAALAGLVSGVLPHQGLTNLEIAGFSNVNRTVKKFSQSDLNTMAEAGTWIVTQDLNTGDIYSRHALTTGDYDDINQREEMITRNVDSISFRFKDTFKPFIGIANAVDSVLNQIRVDSQALIDSLKSANFTQKLGGQLVNGTLVEVRVHQTLLDHVVVTVSLLVPYAINNIDVQLVV